MQDVFKQYVKQYSPVVSSLIAALMAWMAAVVLFRIPEYILPSPLNVLIVLFSGKQNWLPDTLFTLYETLGGFGLGVIVGIPLSIAIVYSSFLNRSLYPLILALQLVPKVALAPIIFIALGFGDVPHILVVFLTGFFPIIIDTVAGLNALDPDYVDFLKSLGASKIQIFSRGRFPNALPHIFNGLKLSITFAVIGAVVAEFVESNMGLGFVLLQALSELGTVTAFAALLLLTFMGYGLFMVLLVLERFTIPWYIRSKQARV